ncbi:hypothetical protein GCM10022227_55560 [Streptomyces sedi]
MAGHGRESLAGGLVGGGPGQRRRIAGGDLARQGAGQPADAHGWGHLPGQVQRGGAEQRVAVETGADHFPQPARHVGEVGRVEGGAA